LIQRDGQGVGQKTGALTGKRFYLALPLRPATAEPYADYEPSGRAPWAASARRFLPITNRRSRSAWRR
jgi:hypothetical protein